MSNENVLMQNLPYTLGRGKLLVRKDADTAWLDLGNISEMVINSTVEELDHRSSRCGIKRIDRTTVTQQDFAGNFVTDTPVLENMKLFFMASTVTDLAQTGGTLAATSFFAAENRWIYLGFENFTSVVVKNSTEITTYVEGTDYEVDLAAGLVAMIDGGGISDADELKISGTYGAQPIEALDAGEAQNQKRHIWFIGCPAEGVIQSIKGYANLIPSGDLPLITDEWQSFTVNFKFEKHTDYPQFFRYFKRNIETGS